MQKSAANEVFNGKFRSKNTCRRILNGEEMSFLLYQMETILFNLVLLKIIKEYLRRPGKNTGGMGAYSPSRLESSNLNNKILNKIIKPTLKGLSDLNTDFQGFLYAV